MKPYIKQRTDCKTCNIIYLITCKRCGIQYVGETKRNLFTRMSEHLRSIKKEFPNTLLVNHFSTNNHNAEDMEFQILDSISEENTEKRIRTDKELFWIKLLNTAYPLGLNDQIKGYGNITDHISPFKKAAHPYWRIKLKIANKQRKKKRSKRQTLSTQNRYKVYEELINANTEKTAAIVRQFSKTEKRKLIDFVSGSTNLTNDQCLKFESILANYYWDDCTYTKHKEDGNNLKKNSL